MLDKVEEISKKYQELKEIEMVYINCFLTSAIMDSKERLIGVYVRNNKDLLETVRNHMDSKIKSIKKELQDEEVKL